jgi:hypothetical protein
MRWKHGSPKFPGDERTISKFLFFPMTLNDETRWLERAWIVQAGSTFWHMGASYIGWENDRFIDESASKGVRPCQ